MKKLIPTFLSLLLPALALAGVQIQSGGGGSGSGTVDGTGTANYLPKMSDSNTITDSVAYDDGTNIGIGTTNPGGRLHIVGSILALTSSGPSDRFFLIGTSTTTLTGIHKYDTAGSGYSAGSYFGRAPTGADNYFSFLDSPSNTATIGAGAARSSTFLTIKSPTTFATAFSVGVATTGTQGLTVSTTGAVSIPGALTVGSISGDGSALTGITGAADNMGTHTSTRSIDAAGFGILNLASATFSGNGSAPVIKTTHTSLSLVTSTDGGTSLSTFTFYGTSITASNGYNIYHATIPWNVTVASGIGFNGLTIPLGGMSIQGQATITQIDAVALPAGATVLFQIDERTLAGVGSAGTDVFSASYSTATSPGVSYTSFSNATIASGSQVVLKTHPTAAGAGSPAYLNLTIWYKEQ